VHVSSRVIGGRWRARWLIGLIGVLVALPVLAAGSASAATAPPWTIQVTQNPAGFNNLEGVSCPSATRCVAAGFDEAKSVETVLAETWNGTIWQVPTLVKGDPLGSVGSSFLTAVSCPVTTKCEMVGRSEDASSNIRPVAAVWNGFLGKASVASQAVPLPPGATFGELSGVSCTSVSACVAVGDFGDATGGGALAERWDGSRWQLIQAGLAVGGTSAVFSAVSCSSATFCMAVGSHGSAELVATWNGSTWLFVLASNFNAVPVAALNGVSCTADGACMAVGQQSNPLVSGGSLTLGLKWIRGQFFLQNIANLSSTVNVLHAVSCISASDCLAVGHYQDFRGQQDTLAEHWDGTSWSFEATPNPVGTVPDLQGVSCSSAATCTAVGIFKTFSRTFDTLAERFVAAGSPHGFSLTSRGTVLALLRKPRTLELLVFQRGRHGHLLGAVALGSHPRGLSRIRWNLRVGGRKLRAGTTYTAELVAVFGRGVTSDGPAVTFALTRAGLVRVLSSTCSVTAAQRGRC
jgi:hypothetical protein